MFLHPKECAPYSVVAGESSRLAIIAQSSEDGGASGVQFLRLHTVVAAVSGAEGI